MINPKKVINANAKNNPRFSVSSKVGIENPTTSVQGRHSIKAINALPIKNIM